MKKNNQTIPLEDAFLLLENSTAVIVDDNFLVYPEVSSLNDEGDHDFLILRGKQNQLAYYFSEEDNKTVVLDGDYMRLVCINGHSYRLQLLQIRQLGQPELKYTLKSLKENQ